MAGKQVSPLPWLLVRLTEFDFGYPFRIGSTGVLDQLERRVVQFWDMATLRHGYPNLPGQLGGQFVKLQGSQQTEYGLWCSGRDSQQTFRT